ncbi:hypothetical protein EMIT0P43_10205 [Pseudomonas jessenii]
MFSFALTRFRYEKKPASKAAVITPNATKIVGGMEKLSMFVDALRNAMIKKSYGVMLLSLDPTPPLAFPPYWIPGQGRARVQLSHRSDLHEIDRRSVGGGAAGGVFFGFIP